MCFNGSEMVKNASYYVLVANKFVKIELKDSLEIKFVKGLSQKNCSWLSNLKMIYCSYSLKAVREFWSSKVPTLKQKIGKKPL